MADFQSLFDSAPDAYVVLHAVPDHPVLAANRAFVELVGVAPEALVGRPFLQAHPAGDDPGAPLGTALERAIATGAVQVLPRLEYPFRPDSAAAVWSVCLTPLADAAGRIDRVLVRLENVSDLVRLEQTRREQQSANDALRARAEQAAAAIAERNRELDRTHRELQENQQRLRETRTRLDVAGRTGEVATWIWDPKSDQVFADDTLSRWFQVRPDRAHGGSLEFFLEAVHPEDLTRLRTALQEVRAGRANLEAEFRVARAGDEWRRVVARSWTEHDPSGTVRRLVGVVLDVTELRRTAQALAETREQLHLAADAAELGTFSWTPETGELTWNARCRDQFWIGPDEPVDIDVFYQRVHPEDRAAMREHIERAFQNQQPFDFEYRIVSPQGAMRWVHAKGRARRDESGRARRLEGIVIDVSHQKQMEADLVISEARYRLVVESMPEYAIFILDDDGRVTHWNSGAERLLGYSEAEILGQSARILFTPEDRERGEPEKEIHTAKNAGVATDDRWHCRKDGTRFFVSGLMCALNDRAGRRIGLAKIMRDVTERQAGLAERERLLESERAARSEAERTSRLKDEFLATLSHELRTPLNAILGWTQVLKAPDLTPEDIAQGLEVIDRNTRVQARLIEDLLDMSRIISGKVRLDVQPVALASVVNAAVDSVRTAADAKGIRLTAVVHGAGVTVAGDPNRLQQVIWNLLTNSIKFTPSGGQVNVLVSHEDQRAIVAVSDNGIGITADFLPHVFERFRQADASTTRQHGGLGIGLSIVRQLVELHGGEIRAESAGPGAGATFTFTIPLVAPRRIDVPLPSRPRPPAPAHAAPAEVDLSGIRVLVVDDQPDSGGLVKRVLESRHAEVLAAQSMSEALEQFEQFRPHLLLSDIGMPQHDGYELIQRIRELPHGHGLPAAALTALARGEDRSRALQAGFTTHIAKPVEPAELLRVVASLAGRAVVTDRAVLP
jgi:PAS domain S-box-containing protein